MRCITSSLIIAAVLTGGIAVAPAVAAPAVVDADSSVATAVESSADSNTEAPVTSPPTAATVAAADGAPTRVIVHLDAPVVDDTTASADDIIATRAALRSAQNSVTRRLAGTGSVVTDTYTLIPAMAAQLTPAGMARLADDPTVVSIERDVALPPVLDGTTSIVTADDLWATGVDGTDWAVAVLDTGVDTDHPMFSDGNGGTRVVAEACFSYTTTFDRAVVDDDGNTTYETHARSDSLCPGGATSSTATGSGADCASSIAGCGHGTHVAGIAAGGEVNTGATTMSGVARGADIIAIQVFSEFTELVPDSGMCSPYPSPCVLSYTSDQVRALQHVADLSASMNIAAVNMSLGGGRYTSHCDSTSTAASVRALERLGIATVIAAGNNGYSDAISSPACISDAVAVGSTTNADDLSYFSNTHPTLVDVYAPGTSINSALSTGGYASYSGTSMAAPHVAGAFALMRDALGADPSVESLTARLIENGVAAGADRQYDPDPMGFTHPRIDIAAAVDNGVSPALTVRRDGTGDGTVTSTPAGINCGDTCRVDAVVGQTFVLTATPSGASRFTGWTGGGCDGNDPATRTCTVTVDSGITVVATFGSVAPDNDNFADATTVSSVPFINVVNTDAATDETGEPVASCDGLAGASAWYRWTPSSTGQARVDTATATDDGTITTYDTVLTVYTGSTLATLNEIGCDYGTQFGGWTDASVDFAAVAGTTYYLRVAGYDSAGGTAVINIGLIPTSHSLTVTTLGDGTGTVTSLTTADVPAGTIDCGSTCSATIDDGTTVILEATPAAGTEFIGWTNSCTGTTETRCAVTMDEPHTVTAVFDRLLDNDDFSGRTTVATLPTTTTLDLSTATMETGEPSSACGMVRSSVWFEWTAPDPALQGPFMVTARDPDDALDTIIAVWDADTATPTLADLDPVICNDDVWPGLRSVVRLSDSGSFGDPIYVPGETYYIQVGAVNGAGGPIDITIAEGERRLTVDLTPVDGATDVSGAAVELELIDTASLTDNDYYFIDGTEVTLRVFPPAEQWFSSAETLGFRDWGGDCSGSSRTCTVDVDGGDKTAVVNLALGKSLSVALAGTGTGTVVSDPYGIDCSEADDQHWFFAESCSSGYLAGETVTLTATADDGSVLTGWDSCTPTDTAGECSVAVDAATEVTATFATVVEFTHGATGPGTVTVTANSDAIDTCGDACERYLTGTEATLSATPTGNGVFAGWTGSCSGREVTCDVTLDDDVRVAAVFVTPPDADVTITGTVGTAIETSTTVAAYTCATTLPALPAGLSLSSGAVVGTPTATADGDYLIASWDGSCDLAPVGAMWRAITITITPAEVVGFTPVDGERVVNTRDSDTPKQGATAGYGDPLRVNVGALDAIPADAAAVAVNITATGAEEWGFVAAYPCASDDPEEWPGNSNVNFDAGATVANSAIVPLDDGHMCLLTYGKSDVIVDVSGYFAGGFTPIDGERPVNSRDDADTPKQGATKGYGDSLRVNVGALDAIPADAAAVAVNITATGAEEWGFVAAYPCSSDDPEEWPGNSNVNFDAGATVANSAIVPLDDGHMCLLTYGKSDVIVDVSGYFAGGFTPIDGERPVNSRDDADTPKQGATKGYGDPLRVNVGALDAIPADAAAVAVNITATGAEEWGFVAAYPCASDDPTEWPGNSNVNFDAGATVANSAIVPLDDGYMCLLTYGKSDVIVDVVGYMS